MYQILKIAIRDLGRNRRRSFFSALALAIGLALLLLVASFFNGEMNSAMDSTIRLQSGHIQVRAATYEESKASLKWEDLVVDPEQIVAQIESLDAVKLATPRLYASGIVAVREESAGVRIFGIDPLSEANDPYRVGMLEGEFLTPDDRQGVLIGEPLAEKMALQVGDSINLSVNTSGGDVDEQAFTIRGIYSTQTFGFDSLTVFMPIAKAQTITQTEKHTSFIFVLLHNKDDADAVAAALQGTNNQIRTWTQMNELILQTEAMANSYIYFMYLIVLGITATVIINTLIMSVFERTREIGILAAIGMKSRQIMSMFLLQSTLLAVGGVIMGLIFGLLVVTYFTQNGFYIGNMGLTGMLIGNTIYAQLTLEDTITLTVISFIITLLAGLYPAMLASRMEPVQALRGGK